jgi:hypothetical protein
MAKIVCGNSREKNLGNQLKKMIAANKMKRIDFVAVIV